MVDYGIKRPDYVNAFLENIKWSEASKRFCYCQVGITCSTVSTRGLSRGLIALGRS